MTTNINSIDSAVMEKELSLRNYELNQFVYHVSHDLMAPLCRIKGLLELVVRERPVGHHDLLNHIKQCIDQLSQFTGNTLGSIKKQITTIYDKLGVRNRVSAALLIADLWDPVR